MKNQILIFIIIFIFSCLSCVREKHKNELLVSSAISMREPLEKIAKLYNSKVGLGRVIFNFASSGELCNQIINSANVDVFISASDREIKRLREKNMIIDDSTKIIASGSLVVISLDEKKFNSLDFLLTDDYKYLAIGETNTVPAGYYAIDVLENSGIINSVSSKLVYAKNASEVLAWVDSGNAYYGITYKSDIINNNKINVVYNIDKNMHREINYISSIISTSKNLEYANNFIDFLDSALAKKIFIEYGFIFE